MEANVILAKCSKTGRAFGVRIEKRNGDWIRTWAFSVDEAKAKREGYHKAQKITGSLRCAPEFPGCPYCGATSFVLCNCWNMNCLAEGGKSAHCHHCNTRLDNLVVAESFNIKAGGY